MTHTAQHFWVHHLSPVAIQLGPLPVRWYGLMYVLGFLAAYLLLWYRYKKRLLGLPSKEAIQDLLFYGFCGVLIGGRLGACFFYEPLYYLSNPLQIFAVWKGGMSSHGGFAGVLVALWLFARRQHVPFWHLVDNVVIAATPGLFLGRIGNFINGELWGKVTHVRWAVVFPGIDMQPRHPVQLYQACTEGVLLFAILLMASSKKRRCAFLSGVFALCYSVFRIFTEAFRESSAVLAGPGWAHLTKGQWYSIATLALGIGLLLYSRTQREYP